MAKRRTDRVPLDSTGLALSTASERIGAAAAACLEWEEGGDPHTVTETAAIASASASIAIEAVVSDEPWDKQLEEPTTRRGRLAYAGWLLLLAGADEGAQSCDLFQSSELFERAASS